jgi:hypothetical protein
MDSMVWYIPRNVNDFKLESMDGNYVRGLCRSHTFMAYVNIGRKILLYTDSLLSRESLDLLLRRVLRIPNFWFRSVRFSHVWGFQSLVIWRSRWRSRYRTCSREGMGMSLKRTGGEGRRRSVKDTLTSIHHETPSQSPALDTREMVLKDLKSGVRFWGAGQGVIVVSKRG